jgi:hypothetical protein
MYRYLPPQSDRAAGEAHCHPLAHNPSVRKRSAVECKNANKDEANDLGEVQIVVATTIRTGSTTDLTARHARAAIGAALS